MRRKLLRSEELLRKGHQVHESTAGLLIYFCNCIAYLGAIGGCIITACCKGRASNAPVVNVNVHVLH